MGLTRYHETSCDGLRKEKKVSTRYTPLTLEQKSPGSIPGGATSIEIRSYDERGSSRSQACAVGRHSCTASLQRTGANRRNSGESAVGKSSIVRARVPIVRTV